MFVFTKEEKNTLREAAAIYKRMGRVGALAITNPDEAANIFIGRLSHEEREHFEVAFCDIQNKILSVERLFSGTVNASAVYPREIVKRALELNSTRLLLSHNHPSGVCKPSEADKALTAAIQDAGDLLGIQVLDHIIVGSNGTSHSMARHQEMR